MDQFLNEFLTTLGIGALGVIGIIVILAVGLLILSRRNVARRGAPAAHGAPAPAAPAAGAGAHPPAGGAHPPAAAGGGHHGPDNYQRWWQVGTVFAGLLLFVMLVRCHVTIRPTAPPVQSAVKTVTPPPVAQVSLKDQTIQVFANDPSKAYKDQKWSMTIEVPSRYSLYTKLKNEEGHFQTRCHGFNDPPDVWPTDAADNGCSRNIDAMQFLKTDGKDGTIGYYLRPEL